ncbi:hypothetical protein SE17_33850, partial [Kouleothrix aurantiaca]
METLAISQLFDLRGKSAIVTGGSKGIGLGIVERLSEAGASVMIADVDTAAAEAEAARLRDARRTVASCPTDMRAPASIRAMAQRTVELFGRLDILVNNAGIFPMAPALDVSAELWDSVLEVNLRG